MRTPTQKFLLKDKVLYQRLYPLFRLLLSRLDSLHETNHVWSEELQETLKVNEDEILEESRKAARVWFTIQKFRADLGLPPVYEVEELTHA